MQTEDYLKDTLDRGAIFESMVAQPGWKYLRAFIENSVKTFSTRAINEDMDEKLFLVEKGKVKGLLSLLAEVENSIQILKNERKKQTTEPTEL